jgi:TolB protein
MRTTLQSAVAIALCFLAAACDERIVSPPTAPDRPTGLTAMPVPPKSVRLSWLPVESDEGTITYTVYRNDQKLGDVAATEFVDSTIVSNTAYTWYVSAKTREGGVSAPSDPVSLAFGDITPPTVASTTPANNATGTSRLPVPTITFSEAMIPASVTAVGGITAKITNTSEPVYGTVDYDAATRTADFWPLSILPARTSVTLTVTSNVRDVAGNGPGSSFTLTFTTGDTPASNAELPAHDTQLLVSVREMLENASRHLYKMRPDGTGNVKLTAGLANDFGGSWSPDGRHILFYSDRNGSNDVYLMREDGRGVRRLTSDASSETRPHWAPNAKRIIFMSTKEGVSPAPNFNIPSDVWSMNPDGSAQINLTKTPGIYEEWPHISPDGARLLFSQTTVGVPTRIMVSNGDGSNAHPFGLVIPDYREDVASWSPDGTQIAFTASMVISPITATDVISLFLANADGSNVRRLVQFPQWRFPAWSPDGSGVVLSYGVNEFFGRFGEIRSGTLELNTLAFKNIGLTFYATEVMSPQAWRR